MSPTLQFRIVWSRFVDGRVADGQGNIGSTIGGLIHATLCHLSRSTLLVWSFENGGLVAVYENVSAIWRVGVDKEGFVCRLY